MELSALEDEAAAALAAGDLGALVSVRGKLSRAHRAAGDPQQELKLVELDRALGTAITAQHVKLRRSLPVPIPAREVELATTDPADLAEARRVRAEMDELADG